jgi:peptide/nickel transport system substrate-binding protein
MTREEYEMAIYEIASRARRRRLVAHPHAQALAAALVASVVAGPVHAQDAEVTIVLNEELETVEPCMASQSNVGRVTLQNISETLTEFVPGEGLQPRLAESWEETAPGTWRFTLRDGVAFSDGSALDAEDVRHSFERIMSETMTCEIARYFGGMEIDIAVVDDRTIDFSVDPAQPVFPLLMSTVTVVPSETPMEFVRSPVGTGPYVLSQWVPGQSIELERRDDYWGEAPEVTRATYVFRPDGAVRAAMIDTEEADIAPLISELEANDPERDFSYPNSETTYLRIDAEIPPLDDVRVRRALNLAVNRAALLGTLVPEQSIVAAHLVPPTTSGTNPDLEPYAYDPDAARALLDEARADGVPVDTEITLIGRTGNFPNVTEVMEALLAMYQDVGLNVRLEMMEVAEWADIYTRPYAEDRGPQLVQAMHDNARGDPVFSMYPKYACDGLQSAYCDPELDAMILSATAATGAERDALWRDVFTRIHEEAVADVLLFHMVGFSRVGERLDFTPSIATNSELQLSQIGFR